jgi:hypothetical protein
MGDDSLLSYDKDETEEENFLRVGDLLMSLLALVMKGHLSMESPVAAKLVDPDYPDSDDAVLIGPSGIGVDKSEVFEATVATLLFPSIQEILDTLEDKMEEDSEMPPEDTVH